MTTNKVKGRPPKFNDFVVEGDTTRLTVRAKDGSVRGYALVDTEDLTKINKASWVFGTRKYLMNKWVYNARLHHVILGIKPAFPRVTVDHINGDPTDNRKCNLRVVNHRTNMLNRKMQHNNKSGVVGVHWRPEEQKWIAQIARNGACSRVGSFKVFEEAIAARRSAEEKYYGDGFCIR